MTQHPRTFTDGVRSVHAQWRYLPRVFQLVWDASHGWTLAWLGLLIVQGILPVASVFLIRALVNQLVPLLGKGALAENFAPLLWLAALTAGVFLLNEVLSSAADWIRATQAELVRDHISLLIQSQAIALDLSYYESPNYYDQLWRARVDAQSRPTLLLENGGNLLQNGITLVAMGAVLIPYSIWLPLALFVSTVPALYVVLRYSLRQFEWRRRVTEQERRAWYYDMMLTGKEAAAELRLFDLGSRFKRQFKSLRESIRGERFKIAKDQAFAEFIASLAGLAAMAGAVAWMLGRALAGQVTLGDLTLLYQAFTQGQRLLRALLENIGQIYLNSLFLSNLFEFLALQPRIVAPPQPAIPQRALQKGIAFQNVTFRYPDSERVALRDFTLTIAAGQITAIVGANGAGKSTLIKLLCRFYDPAEGKLTLDDVDLRAFQPQALRRLITVLFQEPMRYNETVSENIALGDITREPNKAEIAAVAEAAGADEISSRLPEGYATLLGRWSKGGTDLSVGEWQRIALARALLRRSPILILDEPTSAMDAWAEIDFMRRFHWLTAGQTVLLVTHRFTTALRADIIHVMDAGQIIESGNHAELIARNGRYAAAWRAQTDAQVPLEPTRAQMESPTAAK